MKLFEKRLETKHGEQEATQNTGLSAKLRKPLTRLKLSKTPIILLLSIVMGGIGVNYSRSYIEQQVELYRGQIEVHETMVQVVVPNRTLYRGQELNANDLSVREIPAKYADANALIEGSYEAALGQRLAFDLEKGRSLLWAHLEGGRTPTFSGMVPNGSRALTVRVDEINSISGFLQPSDRIDLLLSYGNGNSNVVLPLLEKLVVIATGVQTRVNKNGDAAQRAFNTITINVSPDDAQKITLAQQMGKLTAVLRNPDDNAPMSSSPMTAARLLNLPTPTVPKIAKRKRSVVKKIQNPSIEYIIGGV